MKIFGALAFFSLTAFASAQQPQENLQALTTTQMIPAPEIYGPVFVDGAKVQEATGDFNPAIKVMQIALDLTPDEARTLEGVSADVKKADDNIEVEARKVNRKDPDYFNKYNQIRGGKKEKWLLIRNSFRGNRLDRFNYLFKASEVYHMPRLVSREEVVKFSKTLRQDTDRLGNQIGLDKEQSAKLAAIIDGYYSDIGHSINDVAFLQEGNLDSGVSDNKVRTIKAFDRLLAKAIEVRKKTENDLNALLDKKQLKTVADWLGWTVK